MGARILLINPPGWNVYAPHLAIPLLTACLRQAGFAVRAVDLGIESTDWLLSSEGLGELAELFEERLRRDQPHEEREWHLVRRAEIVWEAARQEIDQAKEVLRSAIGLADNDRWNHAKTVVRNALWCVSAAFPGLTYNLNVSQMKYSVRSTRSVLQATVDARANVYRWVAERLLPRWLRDDDLALAGVSISADTQLIAAMTICRLIRELRPDVRIVVGGNFATRMVSRWAGVHPFFELVDDFIAYEGEHALVQLAEEIFGKRSYRRIPGLVRAQDDILLRNPPEAVELDDLPTPDFSDLPLRKYFSPRPVLPVFASRSCVYSCAFCAIPFASNQFRIRKAGRVVDDMEALARRHGVRHFAFVDELLSVRSLREISAELIRRNSGLYWYGETRFSGGVDRRLTEQLRASGCRRMQLGLETFNQRVLDAMKKGTNIRDVELNVEGYLAAKIPVHLFVIIGFPGETREEALRTISFVEKTVRRSREEFGVPYSTWGGGRFVLDLLSPVGKHPEAFGVEVVAPGEEEDLALTASYKVSKGLTQQESAELAAAVAEGRALGRGKGWEELFHWSQWETSEEELFVRACEEAQLPSPRGREVVVWPRYCAGGNLWLKPEVQVKLVDRSVIGLGKGPVLALYRPDADYVFELPADAEEWLLELRQTRRWGERVEAWRKMRCGELGWAEAVVGALVRFGFCATDIDPSHDGLGVAEEVIWFQEPLVVVDFDPERRGGRLVSLITGKSVVVNEPAYKLWRSCERGVTLGRLAELFGIDRREALGSLRTMCAFGLCYAVAEVE